jgi:DNA-binding response OmpR family regulator
MARILVIDDNDLVRASTRSILESEGYLVEEAGDGDVGIARAKACGPDLILTDIVMPNKEGIEMIRDLRGRGYDGPIIAMSGGGRLDATEVLDLAGKLGADACIAKPFKKAELLAKVKACLQSTSN